LKTSCSFIKAIILSIPAAAPVAGISLLPISFSRSSYLPPPAKAVGLEILSGTISKTVFV